jgi:4-hydroxy-tetrahydrodipicolinate synthase
MTMKQPNPGRTLPSGAYCDLVTPFHDGKVDLETLEYLVRWQIDSGISGIVVCGLAGEATSLTESERVAVVGTAIHAAAGDVPVLVGTGTNATASTIAQTTAARRLGADGVVVVTPYYNKPSQEGIFRHIEATAAATTLPIVVCNAPNRTAIDLSPRLTHRLSALPGIVGIVDCTGNIGSMLPAQDEQQSCLRHFSGHDLTSFAFNVAGGFGTVSIAANVAPRLVSAMHVALATGNIQAASALNLRLRPLMEALEREPAPAVAKQALQFVLGTDPETRLPLTPVEPETAAALRLAVTLLPHRSPPKLAV